MCGFSFAVGVCVSVLNCDWFTLPSHGESLSDAMMLIVLLFEEEESSPEVQMAMRLLRLCSGR